MLQRQTLLSAANMEAAELTILNFPLASSTATDNSMLVDFFLSISVDSDLQNPDLVIIYDVRGYIERSVTRRRKCLSCKNLFIDTSNAPDI